MMYGEATLRHSMKRWWYCVSSAGCQNTHVEHTVSTQLKENLAIIDAYEAAHNAHKQRLEMKWHVRGSLCKYKKIQCRPYLLDARVFEGVYV